MPRSAGLVAVDVTAAGNAPHGRSAATRIEPASGPRSSSMEAAGIEPAFRFLAQAFTALESIRVSNATGSLESAGGGLIERRRR